MPSAEQTDDSIYLRPYLEAVWRRRYLIGAAIVAVSLAFLLYAIVRVIRSPTERVATLHFRLLFPGAAEGQYPNGTPFSPMEIVSTSVLAEVFRINELQRFGTVQAFKESLSVLQTGPDLDLLSAEYQGRLADARLTSVERAAIEAEYRSRREALRDPSYALSYRRMEGLQRLPRDLGAKVLGDILETWAHQAQVRKGVLTYDIAILSDKVLVRETIQRLDYLVAADRLRAQATRVMRTIDKLNPIGGAQTMRTPGKNVSLTEARAKLEDVLRFELEPLMGTIRAAGLTKDPRALSLYASNMVFQLQLDKREAEARARALMAALGEYVSQNSSRVGDSQANGAPARQGSTDAPVMPQLTESFLDRLQRMAVQSQAGEMEYRRRLTNEALAENTQVAAYDKELSYYEGLVASLRTMPANGDESMAAAVSAQIGKAFDTIEQATNDVAAIYTELSTQNLNPAARLYVVTAPYAERTFRSVSIGGFGLLYAGVVLATILAGIAIALVSYVVRPKTTGAA